VDAYLRLGAAGCACLGGVGDDGCRRQLRHGGIDCACQLLEVAAVFYVWVVVGVVVGIKACLRGEGIGESSEELGVIVNGRGSWLLGETVEIVIHDLECDDRFHGMCAVCAWGECGKRRGDLGVEVLLA
jgi:hypothetical protein